MYDLHLTAEQREIRDTVRDFVEREIKPVVLHPDRLQDPGRGLPLELLDKASQMGLRALALSEEAGGAGAECLTSCIVFEELGAGDVDLAVTLAETSRLGHVLFDRAMTPAQRAGFLPRFLADDRYHLAFAAHEADPDLRWKYHRPAAGEPGSGAKAVRQGNGDWIVNGATGFVANAPVAKLIAVQVRTDSKESGAGGLSTLLVPRDTPGLVVREALQAGSGSPGGAEAPIRWHHGAGGELIFQGCRVPGENLLGEEGQSLLDGESAGPGDPQLPAINLGVGRAAYEAAVNYAKLRVQGGRPIIEHQAIGTILAEIAIKLEVARSIIRQAAWARDHPDAVGDGSLSDLPLQTIARVFTSEAVREITESAAECFGAMGVMLDMPLPKYVHEARVFLHWRDSNSVARFRIAEALAGYRRAAAQTPAGAAVAAAA